MNKNLPPIIIDTDAGHDDALAMMLLIKSKLLDIKMITTVAGNSNIKNITRNVQAILDLLKESRINLYSGSKKPLKRSLITAVVHGESGLDGLDTSQTIFNLTNNADQKIIEIIKANPKKISILAIGPLTNIAVCLQKNPDIAEKIKEIIIMGGAINVPGNKNRVAEFNMFVDPEAADIVFKSKVKKILVPLDPCNDIVLGLNVFNPLSGTLLYKPLKLMMKHFISGIKLEEGVKGMLVYDALAAYYLINPKAFKLEPMDIVIETKGEYTYGMTVAEKRIAKEKHNNVMVVKNIDRNAFLRDLVSILKN